MKHLLTLLLLLPLISSAQSVLIPGDTILIERNGSQLYSSMSATGLRSISERNPPTSVNRDNFPVGLVLANSRPTFYIWRNTCPSQTEDSIYMHIGPVGCWQRATNNYITASWCLERVGDDFRIDMSCLMDSLRKALPALDSIAGLRAKVKSDSAYAAATYQTKVAAAAWDATYAKWMNLDTATIARTNRTYANPSFIGSLDVSKVTNGASIPYVDAGVEAVRQYGIATFQPKGNYLTTPQTLTLSGRTLGITNGNQVTLPKDTQTVSIAGNVLTLSNGGGSVTIPQSAYTAGTGISIASNVISNTAPDQTVTLTAGTGVAVSGTYPSYTVAISGFLRPISMPNITVAETALVALSAGVRNVVVTCTGIIAGDRVIVVPTTAPPGYMVGAAVATAANQITVQLTAPLLAIGASYSIPCTVAVLR